MTENKQFKLKIIGDINDVDSEIILKDGGQPLCEFISIEDARLVKDLLNALYDENGQLKKENKELRQNKTDKRYENVAKDDSVVIQDTMLNYNLVDCDDIVEVLNEKETLILHYEKRIRELQNEIDNLKGSSVRIGELQSTGDVE